MLPSPMLARLQGWYAPPEADLFMHQGVRYPACFFPAGAAQRQAVNSILGPAPTEQEDLTRFPFLAREHLLARQQGGHTLHDNPTFVLGRLQVAPTLHLTARLGSYFNMLMTCDALEHELRAACANGAPCPEAKALPLRQHLASPAALFDGHNRSAIIGMTVLVVYARDGTYWSLVGERSGRTAIEPGRLQVIPAGVFGPISADIAGEWDLQRGMLRETLEELFGLEDATPGQVPLGYFADFPAYRRLVDLLAGGGAALRLAGIAVNLLTLRPEVCAVLLIHDPTWAAQLDPQHISWEMAGRQLYHVPVAEDAAVLAALPADAAARFTPQGSVALWAGLALARQELSR
ncbi:MAG: hypothetical protein HC915_12910 [Anaerolineae bacterium]|nr:hypothetical protein [Anaerolineae bacterium]